MTVERESNIFIEKFYHFGGAIKETGITQAPFQQAQLGEQKVNPTFGVAQNSKDTHCCIRCLDSSTTCIFYCYLSKRVFKADIFNASRRVYESQPRPAAECYMGATLT